MDDEVLEVVEIATPLHVADRVIERLELRKPRAKLYSVIEKADKRDQSTALAIVGYMARLNPAFLERMDLGDFQKAWKAAQRILAEAGFRDVVELGDEDPSEGESEGAGDR